MKVLGLDLSLTSTGYADEVGTGRIVPGARRGAERLAFIEAEIRRMVIRAGHDRLLVVLEGYAFGRTNQAHNIGELGGVVRLALYRRGIAFAEVPPASLKLFTTGTGTAGKDHVLAAAIRKWGFEGSGNDEADAHMLRLMGLYRYNEGPTPQAELPAKCLQALGRVAWPELEPEGVVVDA